jgi:hypothetical protein
MSGNIYSLYTEKIDMFLDIEKENYSCVKMHFGALDVAQFN